MQHSFIFFKTKTSRIFRFLLGLFGLVINFSSKSALHAILLAGMLQGLIYVFVIPPWWHYDEPGHFEFAWQIVNFDHWPKFGEVDENMRRQLAASMLRYGYYKILTYQPDLSSNAPVSLGGGGSAQTSYPLYYLVASLPLRLLRNADFAVQNRAVRLMSLAMFLLTLWAAWKALGELLPVGHPLQWTTVLFIALLPGLTDTMTSINDDVGAVLASSLFIWAALRIMRHGFSYKRLVALIFTLLLCYWTKSTTWMAFGLAPLVVLFSLLRTRWHLLVWIVFIGGLIAVAALSLRWGDARYWYRGATQNENTRLQRADAPLGNYVFHLHYQEGQVPWIGQFISAEQMRPLRTKTVTLGAWIWADQPVTIQLPILRMAIYEDDVAYSPIQTVSLTTTPSFYTVTFDIPFEAENGWLELIPTPNMSKNQDIHIYYDGLVLIEGVREGIPHFNDPFAQNGTWNGQPFQNRLRGASAESAQLWFNPLFVNTLSKVLRWAFPVGSFDVFLASLQDWPGSKTYYQRVASTLFQTFWARLARNKVALLGAPSSYEVLQWLTALEIIGTIVFLWRKRRFIPWTEVTVLGLLSIGIWGATIVRGGIELLSRFPAVPWARYAFPVIIPSALVLCAGWREVMQWLKLPSQQQNMLFIVFMLTLDIFALLGTAKYFYWQRGEEYVVLSIPTTFLIYVILTSIRSKLDKRMAQ